MTYIVSGGALNSTHSLTYSKFSFLSLPPLVTLGNRTVDSLSYLSVSRHPNNYAERINPDYQYTFFLESL